MPGGATPLFRAATRQRYRQRMVRRSSNAVHIAYERLIRRRSLGDLPGWHRALDADAEELEALHPGEILMAFAGWPVEAVEFYEGLEADNTKTYWQEHKAVYERSVKEPMEELLEELADDFGSGRVFRPYRDVRFGRDKTPYKLNCAAHLPGGYLSLSADGLFAGSGLYRPEPDQLRQYRAAVDEDRSGLELESIVNALGEDGYDVGAHEVLKTAPRGYSPDHPRIELLNQKGIVMSRSWPVGAWLGTKKAKDRVVACLEAARPLNAWLALHVS